MVFAFSLTDAQGGPLQALTVEGRGSLLAGGRRMRAEFSGDARLRGIPLQLAGEVVVTDGDTFLRIDRAALPALEAAAEPAPVAGLLRRWWLLPSGGASANAESDPGIIPLQLKSLDILHDGGLVQRDGKSVRMLRVRLNRQRMAEFLRTVAEQRGETGDNAVASDYDAEGTVWILPEEGMLYDAEWTLTARSPGRPNATIAVHLRPQAEPVSIERPEGALPLLPGIQPFGVFLNSIGPTSPDTIGGDAPAS